MNELEQVMTFAEATAELGCATGWLNYLVNSNKLIENEDYRQAGRVKLIKKSTVERLKNLKS